MLNYSWPRAAEPTCSKIFKLNLERSHGCLFLKMGVRPAGFSAAPGQIFPQNVKLDVNHPYLSS